jgi:HEAT repeat protein
MAMSEVSPRDRSIEALLRQLSLGLGVYRLFPEKREWPAFEAAVERVRAATENALAFGEVAVEIRRDRFQSPRGPLSDDDLLSRLARVCYERHVEHIQVRGVPDRAELRAVFHSLSMSIDEVELHGGLRSILGGSPASSIELSELGPSQTDEGERRSDLVPIEEFELWRQLQDPTGLAAQLVAGGVGPNPEGDPASVLAQLGAMVSTLSHDIPRQVDVYERIQALISHLPPQLRRDVSATLVQRAESDPFAQRILGTMSNAELARLLVDVGSEGTDPVELARRLGAAQGQRTPLVELTVALARGQEEAGTIITGLENLGIEEAESLWGRSEAVFETVSDLVANDLRAFQDDDQREVRRGLDEAEGRVATRGVFPGFGDYVRHEEDPARLTRVGAVWSSRTRDALRARDADALARLLEALGESTQDGETDGSADPFEPWKLEALDQGVLRALVTAQGQDEDGDAAQLLASMGAAAVEGLFDLLIDEPDRSSRARVLGLLARLAPGHPDRIAPHLSDPRWYVVRNAVTVLGKCGPEAIPFLEEASTNPLAAVRGEALRGLVAVGGEEAVPVLITVAERDPDEKVRIVAMNALGGLISARAVDALGDIVRSSPRLTIRRLALDLISRHPSERAGDVLHELGSRRSRPRVPRTVRREARQRAGSRIRAKT